MLGQVGDLKPADYQFAAFAIDETQRRGRGDDAFESVDDHSGSVAGRCYDAVDIDWTINMIMRDSWVTLRMRPGFSG